MLPRPRSSRLRAAVLCSAPRPLQSRCGLSVLVLLLSAAAATTVPARATAVVPPAVQVDAVTARPWVRWWWPGSAVDRTGITTQLEAFAAAGVGGVEITPIYGARGAEDRYLDFLSAEWIEAVAFTTQEARRLGLRVDMATGTGWPFGGPWVEPADGSASLALNDQGHLTGKPTRMKVKRAAPGGEGLVVDPFSVGALTRYLGPISDALAALPPDSVRAQFHDSFEYYDAQWTPGLPAAFAAQHGYDLNHYATDLLGTSTTLEPDQLARLKADYRDTLGRLHLDYLRAWTTWSHDRGWLTRNQSHGAPANLLDLYGAVDIPETETFGSTPFAIPGLRRDPAEIRGVDDLPEPMMMKMASSAAHVMGRPLTSSETCTWLREHWKVALAMAKPEIDRLFVNGINHVLYHGAVYSPLDASWPGWLFYASTQFNPNNPWWPDFAAMNAYVTRVQAVLQAGEPDNDILLYWPYADVLHDPSDLVHLLTVHHVDWLTQSPFGHTARALADAGYSFDYVSDAQLRATTVRDAQLVTPGHGYRVLVVPATAHLPVATLQAIRDLIEAGGRVILLDVPADVPGLGHLPERRAALHILRDSAAIRAAVTDRDVVSALAGETLNRESMVAHGLEYIRRRTAHGSDYFITNLTAHDVDAWIELSPVANPQIAAVIAEDPLTGAQGELPRRPDSVRPAYRLQLAPGQSLLWHVAHHAPASPPPTTLRARVPAGPAVPLAGPWTLSFTRGGPVLPASSVLPALGSWTELANPETQRFAGTGRYRLEFDQPAAPDDTSDWRLDLGDVRESARVTLNGTLVAVSWSLPHRLSVGAQLRPGHNVLEIEVTNLGANRIRDLDRRGVTWRIMREINFVNIRYEPFDASHWPVTPSGLLGPVTLTPLRDSAAPASP